MITTDAKTLAAACGGEIIAGDPLQMAETVSTDTRSLRPSACWVALKGDRFDANAFAAQAAAAGATVLVVENLQGEVPAGTTVIQVGDGLLALQKMAFWHRSRLSVEVVGITGSNGKTSTKDFTRAVLGAHFPTFATQGNLNNHIGVPLTLLSLDASHRMAVVEMGMNHPGEIAPLCEMARPRVGIITNIGTAHIEFLGSREGIAEEKGALARSLDAEGALFVPAGCDFIEYFRQRTKARVIPVGNCRGLIRADHLRQDGIRSQFTLVIEGREVGEVVLPVIGRHMVKNALLAAGCGWFLGVPEVAICRGLSEAVLTSGRLRRFESQGVTVFDDTYNANPESMTAAIETLADVPVTAGGRRFVVLGRMGELGEHAAEAHPRVGRLAAERGLGVIAVGEGAEGIAEGAGSDAHFSDAREAAVALSGRFHPGDVVLFKASRGAALERVMNEIFPPDN
ncbi:UDP-N-acetylmuramoyl-tripeptide--D-alanyl-D-alanine ligase [Haloferula luteola]|uniref:UDP-N-acetylmuramoyl-tripeptide--D-alanyl-D-alanine ligase n=1 Tax=Haloferula luteola TaxID=595692 RepID=A0A840VB89_9BACT|nr:UDP-N-acetylmuramoyl-tripeptide--D-alanyl-D-alanine ligase [Haloferula luteola]MBB5351948.1 UDP-N-acetylmuramoyl-tripeptide--D-alanyl-D-alanine ligase [Haloferula luteola]